MVTPMPRLDAIVVLGCRILPSGRPGPAAARRASAATSAYRSGLAPWIIASGGRRWDGHIEARVLRREICAAGVPESAVIEELCSLSTHENAIFSAALLRRRVPAPRAAIVTCPFHMPRALANFRAAGVDAIAFPAAPGSPSVGGRAYLGVHEVVCRWLDARATRRPSVIADRARAFVEVP